MDRSLARYWCACVFGAAFVTAAIVSMKLARSEVLPGVKSITIELKRERRRFPKFMKFKQRKENGRASNPSASR